MVLRIPGAVKRVQYAALFGSVSLIAMSLVGVDVAQAQEGPLIYVPNLGGNDVSVIDTPTNTVAPTATGFLRPFGCRREERPVAGLCHEH